jgi:membrane protease YdiL (CAAX protease family)
MKTSPRRLAALALLLVVPAPSIGVTMALLIPETVGSVGQAVWTASKVWMIVLPLLWLLCVERRRISLSPVRLGGLGVGVLSGLVIGGLIVAMTAAFGASLIDAEAMRTMAAGNGLDALGRYIALAVALSLGNALMEEYVWRWFVQSRWKCITGSAGAAIVLSAACFTIHHVLALSAYFGPMVVVIGSLGVFVGGCLWSWLKTRYDSIWPGYVSHVLVDAGVFVAGGMILFG